MYVLVHGLFSSIAMKWEVSGMKQFLLSGEWEGGKISPQMLWHTTSFWEGVWEAPLPPSNDGEIKFMTLKLGLLVVVCFSFPGWASVSCILFGEVYDTRMGVVFRCLVLKTGRTVGRTKRPITSTFDDNFHSTEPPRLIDFEVLGKDRSRNGKEGRQKFCNLLPPDMRA